MPKARKTAVARPRSASSRLVPTRARHDGWTPERQMRFLEALAESGCVTEACATVGLTAQSAYRLRVRPDAQGFRIAWDAALDLGIRRLSDACLSRALHGEAVPHFYQGEQVGEHRRYDNRLAMFLLRYRDPLRYAATLDQMVYSGHPEAAAIAFIRAKHRAEAEAVGVADEPAEEAKPAFTTMPIADATAQAKAVAAEEALVAGNGPIRGSADRRQRILELRRQRWEAGAADRAREQAAFDEAMAAVVADWPRRGGGPAGGDVPSPLSPSAPLSPVAAPPPPAVSAPPPVSRPPRAGPSVRLA